MAPRAPFARLHALTLILAARPTSASFLRPVKPHQQVDYGHYVARRSYPSDRYSLPSEAQRTPLWNCASLKKTPVEAKSPWEMQHVLATEAFCSSSHLKKYMEVFLDKRFQKNYDRVYGKDGWVEEAWVNFLKVYGPGSYYGRLDEKLAQSVNEFSTRPFVLVNFGTQAPPEIDPVKFPKLVLLHARPLQGHSFNFNKMLAILLARAKVGVSLDADMWMVNPEGDRLFKTAREEITASYPYPMMPTHYLDRDPTDQKWGKGRNFLLFACPGCPKPTMRWGQAQPSWTYWAFQFVGNWLAAKMEGQEVQGVPTARIGEDEDLMNVGLWASNATKAQCAWHLMGTPFVWQNYGHEPQNLANPYYNDPKRFPKGIPVGFLFSHAEHNFSHFDQAEAHMKKMKARKANNTQPALKSFYHAGKFYSTFEEMGSANPDLGCVL